MQYIIGNPPFIGARIKSAEQTSDICLTRLIFSSKAVPIGFMDDSNLASAKLLVIPNATLYHFGVLTSSIHMAWVRTVGGTLEVDYSYSNKIIYNMLLQFKRQSQIQIILRRQHIFRAVIVYPDVAVRIRYRYIAVGF